MRINSLSLVALLLLGFSFNSTAVLANPIMEEEVVVEENVGNYVDELPSWAAEHIQVLTDLGVLTGYPDGTFGPNNTLTRAEFAVALTQGLSVLEGNIYAAMESNNEYLYNELAQTQVDLLGALALLDEMQAINAVEKNNYVALGLGYNVSDSSKDDSSNITLMAKVQVIELSDKLAVSIRPFVSTDATAGATATLDYKLSDKVVLYGGAGAAVNWSDGSELTGADQSTDVEAIANAGVEYHLSNDTVTGVDVKTAISGPNSGDTQVLGFIGVKF